MDVCAQESIGACVWGEAGLGNRLIITAASPFYFLLDSFKHLGLTHGIRTSSPQWVDVCPQRVSGWVCTPSPVYLCQPALWPHSLLQEVTPLGDLSYYKPWEGGGGGGEGRPLQKKNFHQRSCHLMGSLRSLLSSAHCIMGKKQDMTTPEEVLGVKCAVICGIIWEHHLLCTQSGGKNKKARALLCGNLGVLLLPPPPNKGFGQIGQLHVPPPSKPFHPVTFT